MFKLYKDSIFKNYANFSGRASRKEFWTFVLFNFIIGFIVGLLQFLIELVGLPFMLAFDMIFNPAIFITVPINIINFIWGLLIWIPSISISIRRLHDINRTGWWYLLPLPFNIVFIISLIIGIAFFIGAEQSYSSSDADMFFAFGGVTIIVAIIFIIFSVITNIVLLIFYILKGTEGNNRFGADPLQTSFDTKEVLHK